MKILFLTIFNCLFIYTVLAQDLNVTSAGYVIPASSTVNYASVNLQLGATLTLAANSTLILSGSVNYNGTGTIITLEAGSTLNAASINMNTGLNGILTIGTGAKVILAGDLNALNPSAITMNNGALLTVQNTINTDFSNITVNPNAIINCKDFNMSGSTALKLNNAKVNVTSTTNGFSLSGGIVTMTNGSELNISNNLNGNSAAINPTIDMSGGSKIYLKKDLNNSHALGNPLFTPGSQPIVILNGTGDQYIRGNNVFYDLICQTSSKKIIEGNTSNTEVQHVLELGNAELSIGDLTLKVSSPNLTAITRGTGFISNDSYNGVFTRVTNQIGDYLFPVGGVIAGTVYYRPVIVRPSSTATGEYAAKFVPLTVNSHPVNQVGTSLIAASQEPLNKIYYHKIRKFSGPAASLSIYYNPTIDAAYNAIAHWNVPGAETNVWSAINDLSAGIPLSPLLSVRANLYNDFSDTDQDFVLAKGKAQNLVSEPTFDVLKKKLDGGYYLTKEKVLYFKFDEEYAVSSAAILNCKIYNKSRNEIPVNTLPVKYGDNRYQLDASYLNTNEYYTLEVVNSKNEKWLLRFKVD